MGIALIANGIWALSGDDGASVMVILPQVARYGQQDLMPFAHHNLHHTRHGAKLENGKCVQTATVMHTYLIPGIFDTYELRMVSGLRSCG
jgi:hypothetical protein